MFVVQSLPRCGTHLLRTAINSHGALWCYHEVFNPDMRAHRSPDMPPAGIRSVAEVVAHCRVQIRLTGFVAHAFTGLAEEEQGPGLDAAFRSRRDVRAGRGLWQAISATTPSSH